MVWTVMAQPWKQPKREEICVQCEDQNVTQHQIHRTIPCLLRGCLANPTKATHQKQTNNQNMCHHKNRTITINTCSPTKPVMVNERWVCPCCKTQKTYHGQSVFWRTPITDDHVFQGRCLKCFPDFTPNTSSLRVVS
ncbi:expressed unknown protein [Seminavis robusta]|uniref:Uncharacterized protein n=1 Tax=Seminavis robusta TaxID=568900 RepID=A0A9N8EUA6_9STRA|nr:expressed unknown protein [Seminavis robusta]|eukprot:Sro1644_g288201.2  (137) ;mRNA; f:21479-21889